MDYPAPKHAVKEGTYYYDIEAKDSETRTEPSGTLYQSHKIEDIPIYVRYNMTDN